MKMVLEHPKSQYYLFRGFVVALPEMLPPNLFLFSFHMVREPSCNRKEILKLTLPLQDKQTKQLVDQFYLLRLIILSPLILWCYLDGMQLLLLDKTLINYIYTHELNIIFYKIQYKCRCSPYIYLCIYPGL